MGIIEEVISEPALEEDEVVLTKRQIIDGFPLFTKQDNPVVTVHYIFEMEQAGNDMTWFNYDMLPDGYEEVEPRKKRKKKSSKADETEQKKIAKKQKKVEKEKKIHLRSYSEASARGNSESQTSSIPILSLIDTTSSQIPLSTTINPTISQTSQLPPRHKSTQISTPISSTPIQTQTTPIITTTSESTHSESTQSDSIPTRQTTPLNVYNPPSSQSDSDVTLSYYSPTK